MGFNLKTWVNRISEYPTRRKLTKSDGSTELVTVERAEGQVSQEGNAFSADEMNDLEKRISEGFDELNSNLDSAAYMDADKSLKTMIDEYVCPNTPRNRTKYFMIQSTDRWFKVECNNVNDNRFTGICIPLSLAPNPKIYSFCSYGGTSTVLSSMGAESSGYLAATKDVTLNADTWTEGASVTLPTTSSKYNVQISATHLNSNPLIERDLVGINGISLNSFTTTKAGDTLKIGCSFVGQYNGGTKLYATHYTDGQNSSRAITSQIYVTYQPIGE